MFILARNPNLDPKSENGYMVIPRPNNTVHAVFIQGGSGKLYQVLVALRSLISFEKLLVVLGEESVNIDFRLTRHYYSNDMSRVSPIRNAGGIQTVIDSALLTETMVNISVNDNGVSSSLWVDPQALNMHFGNYVVGDVSLVNNDEHTLATGTFLKRKSSGINSDLFADTQYSMLPITLGLKDEIEVVLFEGVTAKHVAELCTSSVLFYCNALKFANDNGFALDSTLVSPLELAEAFSDEQALALFKCMSLLDTIDCKELTYYLSRKEQIVYLLNLVIDQIANQQSNVLNANSIRELRLMARLYNYIDVAIAAKLDFKNFNAFMDAMNINQHQYESSIVRSIFGVDSSTLSFAFASSHSYSAPLSRLVSDVAATTIVLNAGHGCYCLDYSDAGLCCSSVIKSIAHMLHDKGMISNPRIKQNDSIVNALLDSFGLKEIIEGAVTRVQSSGGASYFRSLDAVNSTCFENAIKQKDRVVLG